MADAERSAESSSQAPERLTQAVRGWLRDSVRLARVRLELLSVEAREHALGVVQILLAGLSAVILLGLGLGFLAVLLTVLLWDSHRVLALTAFACVFLTLGGCALGYAWLLLQRCQRWFESSTDELRQDEQRLTP